MQKTEIVGMIEIVCDGCGMAHDMTGNQTPAETAKQIAYELSWLRRMSATITRTENSLDANKKHRNETIRAARRAGATWRQIAEATGLTDQGARKAAPDTTGDETP